jgi:hypothetical protein
MQKIVPLMNVNIVAWTIVDSSQNASNGHPGATILDEELHLICGSTNSGQSINASLDSEGSVAGNAYFHKYVVNNSNKVQLEAGKAYWFPICSNPSGTPASWYVTYEEGGQTTYAPTTDTSAEQSYYYTAQYGIKNNSPVFNMTLEDDNGNTYEI